MWDADRVDYPWLAEVPQLARRYDLGDVENEHTGAGVRQVVLMQAADSIGDTELMLAAAAANPAVAGIVIQAGRSSGTMIRQKSWRGRIRR